MAKKSLDNLQNYDMILVDGMNLAARSDPLNLSHNGYKTGMLYGYARFVIDCGMNYPNARIVVLWEGQDSWRRKKYPVYKSKRKSKSDSDYRDFLRRVESVREFLRVAGVSQVRHPKLEADDIAGLYAHHFQDQRILLVSKDRDWWQFGLNDHVDVMYGNQVIDEGYMISQLGYRPSKMTLFKTLKGKGDYSSGVSGIPRFPTKLALKIVECCSDIEEAKEYCRNNGQSGWADRIESHRWIVDRNRELVEYDPASIEEKMEGIPEELDEGSFDYVEAVNILLRNGMDRLVDYWDGGARVGHS